MTILTWPFLGTEARARGDASQHRRDIDRHAELLARGWLILRVSADLLRYRRDVIIGRTGAALRQAGAEWPVVARLLADFAA